MSGAVRSLRWVAENYSLFVGGRDFYDLSGTGQGPWVPLNVLLGRDGTSTLVINADGSINVTGSFTPGITQYVSAGAGQYALALGAVTPVSLTPPAGATAAQISLSGCDARYKDDGGVPASASGVPVTQGASWLYAGPLAVIQFIAQSGSGTLDVSYYR